MAQPVTTNAINAPESGVVYGTSANDQINGGHDGNTVYAGAGDDVVYGSNGNDIIYGGDGNDYLFGSEGNNQLYGQAGNDVLYAGSGNDLLVGGPGDDTMYGGGGVNTAVEDELFRQASISTSSDGAQIVAGPDGTDQMYQVSTLRFLDGTETHDSGSTVAQAYRLYNAAFGRTPDESGLSYWSSALNGGATLHDVANGFLAAPEYQSQYGSLSDSEYVTELYRNVLGRAPDSDGATYWQNQLTSGAQDRAQLLVGFSESSENVSASASVFSNGVFAPSQTAISVLAAYQTVLGRAPDAAGLAYWVDQLQAGIGGTTLAASLIASPEAQAGNTGANASDQAFVGQVIQNANGASDANASAYWTAKIASGAVSRADVATAYASSAAVGAHVAPLLQNGYAV